MTALDNGATPHLIHTKNGWIGYTSVQTEDTRIAFILYRNNETGSSEKALFFSQQLLYHIRNMSIFHLGLQDIAGVDRPGGAEILKRQFRVLDPVLEHLLGSGYEPPLLHSMQPVTSHLQRSERVRFLMQKVQKAFDVGHLALWLEDQIYFASASWHEIHEVDKTLLFVYKTLSKEGLIYDTPVYLTHTTLVEDAPAIGKIPYRYVVLKLSELFTLTLLSGPQLDVNELYEFIKTNVNKEMTNELTRRSTLQCALHLEMPF